MPWMDTGRDTAWHHAASGDITRHEMTWRDMTWRHIITCRIVWWAHKMGLGCSLQSLKHIKPNKAYVWSILSYADIHKFMDYTCIYYVNYVMSLAHKGQSADHVSQVSWLKERSLMHRRKVSQHFKTNTTHETVFRALGVAWFKHINHLTHYLFFTPRFDSLRSLSINTHIKKCKHT